MATLTVSDITRAGLTIAGSAAAAGGDNFANTGKEFLLFTNADASSKTVTLVTATSANPDGLDITDKTVSVPAGESRMIGPFPTGIYNDGNGLVNFTYSGVTSCTVKAVKLPTP